MPLSRRDLIRSGVVMGGAVALTGRTATSWASTADIVAPQFTTLDSTLVRGNPGAGGYTPVVNAPGQPHVVRTDLGATGTEQRLTTRVPLLSFAQITDVHIVDTESPMRLEYVDRLEDSYGGAPTLGGLLTSSYRAQEMLTTQVADSMVQAINRVGRGPVSGQPLSFVIQTGDNSDNCQHNEVRWNIDILDGTKIIPESGSKTKFESVSGPVSYDRHYWHPENTPARKKADIYKDQFGFPTLPGLLDAARRAFTPAGLRRADGQRVPWYAAFGNHDGLVQGNFPQSLPLSIIATGPLKAESLPPGLSQADVVSALGAADATPLVGALSLMNARLVTPDRNRRHLKRRQVVEEHFQTVGTPVGHGFTAENRAKGTAYYTFNSGPSVCCVVLDTVNPNGYYEGSLDKPQFTWLTNLLAATTDRYVMIFSHHTAASMTNPLVATGLDLHPRVLGADVVDLLLAHPQVIGWVNGHTHRNEIIAHPSANGQSGFWELNTAAHIDFPQQTRMVELVDNRDGTLSIFGTMVDHAAPASLTGSGLNTSLQLAAVSRELSANDPQLDVTTARGTDADRNVELLLDDPLA